MNAGEQPWGAFAPRPLGVSENPLQEWATSNWPPVVPTEVRVTDPVTGGEKGQKAEQYSLIPTEALAHVARVYAYGAAKYDRDNWRKGYAWHLSYDAMQRHLNAFWGGEDLDPESGLPHLAHAVFHCMALLVYTGSDQYKDKDDRK